MLGGLGITNIVENSLKSLNLLKPKRILLVLFEGDLFVWFK